MNESQFLEQVQLNQGIIYKLVALYANDTEEKKDLYQEILLQAWKGLSSFRGEAKFSTWLYRICLNTIFTQKRKKTGLSIRTHWKVYLPSLTMPFPKGPFINKPG